MTQKDYHPHQVGHGQTERGLDLDMFLAKKFSNLTHALRYASSTHYGGFSLSCKENGQWFAVARKLDAEDNPVVAFGSAPNPYDALVQLNGSIAAGKWKPDGFAHDRRLGPSEMHRAWLEKERATDPP
jgi:hypothetical protein